MQSFFSPILIVHIAAGFTALLTGLIAIIAKKGLKAHRTNGKIYFWAMVVVAITATFMSLVKDLDFFLMLSLFSLYATYAGFRAIRNKSRRANWLDWVMVAGAIVTCCFMVASGNTILIVFGLLFGLLSVSDIKDFLAKEPFTIKSKRWLIVHIGRMMTAYIATTTAFVVVNFSHFLPGQLGVVVWLTPTAIGTALIFYWVNKYMKKKEIPIRAEIST